MQYRFVLLAALASLAVSSPVNAAINGVFITGHDSDEHQNAAYDRAGLDYLAFGHAAAGAEIAQRASFTVGYLGNFNSSVATGYTTTFIDLDLANWATTAFNPGAFDILMIGSGGTVSFGAAGSGKLNAEAANFTSFFNGGGGIFVHTDQGLGQSFYNFIPSFGTTVNNTISISGAFSATAAGNAIGLTEPVVDADITHSYYTGVNTSLFTVFETFNTTGDPVAIGLRGGSIGGGGFENVPEPSAILVWGLLGLCSVAGARFRLRGRKRG